MKIFKIIAILVCTLAFTSTIALAETDTHTTAEAGTVLTLPGAAVRTGGVVFNFTPSPSTVMSVFTSVTGFTLAAGSIKTTVGNGLEYGVTATESAIFQRDKTTGQDVIQQLSATVLTGAGWLDKAGNAPNS